MWDFETEPEFEAKLQWMREFIDARSCRSSRSSGEVPEEDWTAGQAPPPGAGEGRGLWGAFLDPKLGGPGFGQLKLALMSEIIGRCMISMTIFGVQAPDSGNMELLAHGATDEQKERWLWPNLRGDISSRVRAHRAVPRRRRPDDDRHDGTKPTATSGSSTATSGSSPTRRWPTSCSCSPRPTPRTDRTSTPRCSSSRPVRRAWTSSATSARWAHPDERVRRDGQPRRDHLP